VLVPIDICWFLKCDRNLGQKMVFLGFGLIIIFIYTCFRELMKLVGIHGRLLVLFICKIMLEERGVLEISIHTRQSGGVLIFRTLCFEGIVL
jgi:hypothetical protein